MDPRGVMRGSQTGPRGFAEGSQRDVSRVSDGPQRGPREFSDSSQSVLERLNRGSQRDSGKSQKGP